MARRPRVVMLNYAYHLLVRGAGTQPVFLDAADREAGRLSLQSAVDVSGVMLHAYALATDEIHLVATPREPDGLARLVQTLGRQYVRRFNLRHGRGGALWSGRFRSSLIQDDPYLLIVQRFVETAPVRALLVERPEDFQWSSHRHHLGLFHDPLVTPHAEYWRLGNTPFEREAEYRRRFEQRPDLPDPTLARLLKVGHPVAGDAFLQRLAATGAADLRPRPVGRPRRERPTPA